jgi:hypothetical protein
MVRKTLTDEQKKDVIDLKSFKGAIYNNEAEYKAAFEDKIFKYGKRYYKYRFKFGIRTRFIGENLIVMGIVTVNSQSPDINNFDVNVSSSTYSLMKDANF